MSAWALDIAAERIPPTVPAAVTDRLSQGTAQNLIVLFDDRKVEEEATTIRKQARMIHDDDGILALRRKRYRSIKRETVIPMRSSGVEEVRDYDQLPLTLLRVNSSTALTTLLSDPRVQAVYEDRPVYPHLASSLPFIGQPPLVNASITGNGQTVAVIDTGIDYTLPAFGSCSAPGTPAGCRVITSVDITGFNVTLNQTTNNHGTNVSGIVAGVAPGANIASLNAFFNGSSSYSWILAGIDWAITNRSAYDIGVLNMSLGDGSNNTSPCGDSSANPFVVPINNLRAAGIVPVASSGNSAYSNGISNPACVPGVVSVGAVYDANIGGWSYSACSDSTSAADRITCFSNSASFLTILAPGAQITAAGITMFGTSQAAPHVSGSLAVMRAAYPSDTLDQSVARLTANGVPVTDSRNGITTPRLNLLAAVDASSPSVSLTTPVSGVSVSGTVTVGATASDIIGVERVEFYINNNLTNTDTAAPYSYDWNTSGVDNGTATLLAKAFNTAGVAGQSDTVSVTVANDLTAPTASITTPSSGATVAGTVTISVSASDNVGVSRVEFYVDDSLAYTDTTSPYDFNWDTTTAGDGSHALSAKAYDTVDNMGQSESVSVTVSRPAIVPALYPWSAVLAAMFLARTSGRGRRRNSGAQQ